MSSEAKEITKIRENNKRKREVAWTELQEEKSRIEEIRSRDTEGGDTTQERGLLFKTGSIGADDETNSDFTIKNGRGRRRALAIQENFRFQTVKTTQQMRMKHNRLGWCRNVMHWSSFQHS